MEQEFKSQQGAYIVWFAIALPVLLFTASYVYFVTNHSAIKTQLQLASDSAAIAGGSKICSSKECALLSIESSLVSLIQNLPKNLAAPISYSFDANDNLVINGISATVDSDNYQSWDLSNSHGLKIKLNLGYLTSGEFNSTQGVWQASYPGVPAHLVNNAINVQVEGVTSNLLNFIGLETFKIKANSTSSVLLANEEVHNVAPFALPICSLISDVKTDIYGNSPEFSGDLMGTDIICQSDRIFTQADRYVGSGQPAKLFPGAYYFSFNNKYLEPADGQIYEFFPTNEPNENLINGGFVFGWSNSYFGGYLYSILPGEPQSFHDHFGVVGLPNTESATQTNIKTSLETIATASNKKLFSAKIGDSFSIINSGLTDSNIETNFWNIVESNTLAVDPPESAYLALGTDEFGIYRFTDVDTFKNIVFDADTVMAAGFYSTTNAHSQGSAGACNSARFNFPGEYAETLGQFVTRINQSGNHPSDSDLETYFNDDYLIGLSQLSIPITDTTSFVAAYCGAGRYNGALCTGLNFNNFKTDYFNEPCFHSLSVSRPGTNFIDKKIKLYSNSNVFEKRIIKVKLPVIADFSATAVACRGTAQNQSPSGADPEIDATQDYKIVGFVDGFIYDSDIGHPAPIYPTLNFGTDRTAEYPEFCPRLEPIRYYTDEVFTEKIIQAGEPITYQSGLIYEPSKPLLSEGDNRYLYWARSSMQYQMSDPPQEAFPGGALFDFVNQVWPNIYPFGFTSQSRNVFLEPPYIAYDYPDQTTNCNAFRGKIACGTDFIPGATQNVQTSFRNAVLVQ